MSQRNSEDDAKPGQLELTRGSPRQVSRKCLSGDPKPGGILI